MGNLEQAIEKFCDKRLKIYHTDKENLGSDAIISVIKA
jgi:hypothetical protein